MGETNPLEPVPTPPVDHPTALRWVPGREALVGTRQGEIRDGLLVIETSRRDTVCERAAPKRGRWLATGAENLRIWSWTDPAPV